MAQIHRWQAFQQRLWPQQAKSQYRLALSYIARVLTLRPVWGEAWAEYAEFKNKLNERDGLLNHALQRALVLTPLDPVVRRKVAIVGADAWTDLDSVTRLLYRKNIGVSMSDPKFVIYLRGLDKQGRWEKRIGTLLRSE